jgi:hypothetical protein
VRQLWAQVGSSGHGGAIPLCPVNEASTGRFGFGESVIDLNVQTTRSGALHRLASRVSLEARSAVVVKFAAWVMTGSVALLASGVDTPVDAGARTMTSCRDHVDRDPEASLDLQEREIIDWCSAHP